MKRALILALAASLSTGVAMADSKHHRGDDDDDRYEHSSRQQGWCPPGLAKKNPPCVPPGQAKKARVGDHYYDYEYKRVDRHDDRYDFYRIGDVVVSADRKTGRILHLFDELGRVLE